MLLTCNAICHGQQAKIETPPNDLPLSIDDSIYIDDSRLLRLLQDKLEKAIEAKDLTDAKLLREQLKRTHTNVPLETRVGTGPLMTPRQIYQERLGSVLIMGHLFKCDKCDKWHLNTAGAVVLTNEGIAATNHHVIENNKAAGFGALTRNGDFYPVLEVLAANDDDDIALVRLKGDNFTAAPLGDVHPGDPIAVISHPDKHFYSLTTGIASRFARSRNRARRPVLEISANYARGSSGAPVFGPTGSVVGLVSRTRSIYHDKQKGPDSNFQMVKKICVPSDSIRALIKQ